jgi:ankyrin repeat protein
VFICIDDSICAIISYGMASCYLIPWRKSSILTKQDGTTALMWGALEGHASVVTLLLSANADVNHADEVSK